MNHGNVTSIAGAPVAVGSASGNSAHAPNLKPDITAQELDNHLRESLRSYFTEFLDDDIRPASRAELFFMLAVMEAWDNQRGSDMAILRAFQLALGRTEILEGG